MSQHDDPVEVWSGATDDPGSRPHGRIEERA